MIAVGDSAQGAVSGDHVDRDFLQWRSKSFLVAFELQPQPFQLTSNRRCCLRNGKIRLSNGGRSKIGHNNSHRTTDTVWRVCTMVD